jgi:hypothetical protein
MRLVSFCLFGSSSFKDLSLSFDQRFDDSIQEQEEPINKRDTIHSSDFVRARAAVYRIKLE